MRARRRLAFVAFAAIVALVRLPGELQAADAEGEKFFATEVLPVLKAHCFSCHGGEKKVQGGLELTSREAVLKGGDSGPAVSLHAPAESVLLDAINYGDLKMPPKGKLPQAQIDTLTAWVKGGLPYSASAVAAQKHGPPKVDDQARRFWSFQPVKKPDVPAVKNAAWVRSPVDAFLLSRLEAADLAPAPDASKTSLLRRVHYDLTGLPPAPEQVEAFLADGSTNAFEKVVDGLLASRHYGERWGRHWLDLVRYAETNSFERDSVKPNAWRYRDYVIDAFNQDKPYDQFLREQIAGDTLETVTPEAIVATGYYRLGQWDDEPVDPAQAYYDELDDVLSTTGQAVLGLTVGCARCHDHKIDPFPQRDYYRLLAFLHGIKRYDHGSQRVIAPADDQKRQAQAVAEHERRLADLTKQMAAIEDEVRPHLAGGERDDFKHEVHRLPLLKKHSPRDISEEKLKAYEDLHRHREELRQQKPPALDSALCVLEDNLRETFVLLRGSHQAQGDAVEPGFPSVLPAVEPKIVAATPPGTFGRRRALADWLASAENPLTARVMVNRIWQHHFGRGIVRSTSDFGYRGTPPTHPELLDWLASELVGGGWRLKPLHKQLVMSHAYRMSSRPDAVALKKDPENDLFWRFNLRRLGAEEIRDSILSVSGNLNLKKTGGPSVYPTIPQEVLAGQSRPGDGWLQSSEEDRACRSVYVHVKRSLSLPILATFDAADTDSPCPVRFATTQPTQALAMLNSDFLGEQSMTFARTLRAASSDRETQIRTALRRVTQREPTRGEVERGLRFLDRQRTEHQQTPEAALKNFCLLAMSLNEFLHVD